MDIRPNLRFPIIWKGEEIWPEKQWQWSKERVEQALSNNELVFNKQSGKWSVRYKQYLRDEEGNERSSKPFSVLDGPYTQEGTSEVSALFGDGKAFPFPKPSQLIQYLMSFAWRERDSLVLDFFAGSCSTVQAILEFNRANDTNCRYVMVQLPEPTDSHEFPTIAEIGKERIRRVIKKLKKEAKGQLELKARETPEDLGFRVYKLAPSNFKAWRDYTGDDVREVETLFDSVETPLADGWNEADLLAEVLLLEGFPLDSAVTEPDGFKRNAVKQAESDACAHRLLACFDRKMHADTLQRLHALLAERPEDVFVCLDSALTDEHKMRLSDAGNVKTI
jgi:adenine-specific DNA-methyltransferase